MREYTLIAVDDEVLALKLIEKLCQERTDLRFVKGFSSAESAIAFLAENSVDLVILDIEMPEMNGLELASKVQPPTKLIFSTAFERYALQGFELSAVDYLLKPYLHARFGIAVDKAIKLIRLEEKEPQTEQVNLKFKHDYGQVIIPARTIRYIESINNDLVIYRIEEVPFKVRKPLKTLMDELPSEEFIRIHRSYVVAFRHIVSYKKTSVCIGDKVLPVSPSYRDHFWKMITLKGLPV